MQAAEHTIKTERRVYNMLYGYIEKHNHNGSVTLKIDGHNKRIFYGYSRKSAIAHYRTENNLKYKKITWIDI